MSAQAVLSMMTPAAPATPRGSSAADASGFGGWLAAAVAEGEAGPDAGAEKVEAAPEAAADDGDGSNDQGLAAAGIAGLVAPQTAPPAVTDPTTGTGTAKELEAQVLPGSDAKGAEPWVLPDAASAKATEPQVLPGVTTGKDGEPPVLPVAPSPKGAEPQVLPGAGGGKPARPQVLPGEDAVDISLPTPPDGDESEIASAGDAAPAPAAARPDAGATPPPLRALAERTSKPLDSPEAAAPSGDKPATATAAATAPTGEAPTRPAAAAAPITAPSTDPGPAPTEVAPRAQPAAVQTDAGPAPVREHALSTLSHATVNATAQIAAQILRKLEGRSTRFEIALRPDELGRVDVKLDIDSDGRLAARLAFDNPAAATDLRGRADELRRQLEAAGFQLADDAFEFAERDSGSSAFDRGQDARHGQNRAFAAAARLNNEIDAAQPPRWLALSLSPSGVDMKV